MPPFDADIMERAIAAVHEPRWAEWETLKVPTLAIFAADGMFSDEDKAELIRRRPQTDRVDLDAGVTTPTSTPSRCGWTRCKGGLRDKAGRRPPPEVAWLRNVVEFRFNV